MDKGQKRVLQMLRRVQDFLDELAPAQPPRNLVEQRALLDQAVTRLESHAVRQELGARLGTGDTRRGRELRRLLMGKHMRPIARIAKARGVPGFDKDLRMPAARIDVEGLVAAARSMRNVATAHRQVFVDSGRPEDFLEQLETATSAITAMVDGRAKSLRDSRGATAAIRDEIAAARLVLRQLHAIVAPIIEDNGDAMARWRQARRIGGWPTGTNPAATGDTEPPSADRQAA